MRTRAGSCVALMAMGTALLGIGCASSGLPLEEVSDKPIALLYWDEAATRDNEEAKLQSQSQGASVGGRLGVAAIEDLIQGSGGRYSGPGGQRSRVRGRIILLNPRTLELIPFPAAPPDARPLAWSKDRKRLLYNSAHGSGRTPQLYEFDTQSGEVRRLTRGPVYHLEGDYASENRVLFTWLNPEPSASRGGLKIRALGGGPSVELREIELPLGPRWSSQGDQVTYFLTEPRSRRKDDSKIVVQGLKEGAEPRVVARGREPVFTPDGQWIIYASQTASGWRLRRVRPDGAARSGLGKSHLDARWPTVSPDGRHVAYISNADGIDRLYLRRMDGSGDRILLTTGSVAFPVW